MLPLFFIRAKVSATDSKLTDGKYLVDVNNAYGFKNAVFDGIVFSKPIRLPFEKIEVNCYSEFDLMLRKQYGDYMQLPPIEKRFADHATSNVAK